MQSRNNRGTSANSGETVREEVVNTLLAEVLRANGIPARAERRRRGNIPDIQLELKSGDTVILECKWDSAASQIEAQLDQRLEQHPGALAVIGLLYPDPLKFLDDIKGALEADRTLEWWVHGSNGQVLPDSPSTFGSGNDLAYYLRLLPIELESVDRVVAAAGVIEYGLEQSRKEIIRHARVARRIADLIATTDGEENRAKAILIGCLVLFNALAFQDRLASNNDDVPTVEEAWREGVRGLFNAWRYICDNIDYESVFDLASQILDVLIDGSGELQAAAITPLNKAVEDTRHLEGHDLSGRLFHTLLTDAKFTGAFYTSVPAATLLTRLVFHNWPAGVDWRDHELPGSLNVADLACGTGTLLMAVAAETERLHVEAGGQDAAGLHKAMVEQALHGFDVQLSAVHFAATSLAMLNPEIQFDRMNLHVMTYGVEGSETFLGSLDFLGKEEVAVQFSLSPEMSGSENSLAKTTEGVNLDSDGRRTVSLPKLDLAIMNPPFTRSAGGNLLFGSLPPESRSKVQDEFKRRLRNRPATATAGLGAAFVAAAAPKLLPGEGRLALVLPATVCTGPSWAQTRALIEQDFVLDTVVTSHDPQRWKFSDSTKLSEALLVATRRRQNDKAKDHPTTFVNLWQNPAGVLNAHRVAQAVNETTPAPFEGAGTSLLEVDGQHVGEVVSIPESRLRGNKWAGIQFARADVTRSALRLLQDGEVWVPGEPDVAALDLCPLERLGLVGPDRRDIWDGFERTDTVTAFPMIENHDTKVRQSLSTDPDKYLAPLVNARPGRRLKPVNQLWEKAGRLLIAERLRLNTTRVVSMRCSASVLSNVWWPVEIADESTEKALVLWLNSSLGLLTLLAERTSTEGAWVSLKKEDVSSIPVLDTRQLSDQHRRQLAQLFDTIAELEFDRLPNMVDCPARRALDDGLSQILGLPNLEPLRRLLATEPVVSNQRL